MASINLRRSDSWYTSIGQPWQKLGYWDLWQASDYKFNIPGTPAQRSKGKSLNTKTHGKHQTKAIKIPSTRAEPKKGQKLGHKDLWQASN